MLSTGTIIAQRYEIVELVGIGGMSEVYKAKDHKLNRFVATKVLKPEYNQDPAFLKKFANEAQSAARLSHPNIVSVYDVGEEKDLYYIVMELVEGITLKKYIANYGRLEPKQAVDFALQIASALESAHQNGIVHRDIKPQNIIVSNGGILKVADFGIARIASGNTVTATDAVGSVHYISPEQAKGGYCDAKSDLYSLGVSLYEMLTGQVPFDGENAVSIALKHLNEKITSPKEVNPEIPVSLVEVLEKCTVKSTDMRYQTATALIKDLQKVFTYPQGGFVTYTTNDLNSGTKVMTDEQLKLIREGINDSSDVGEDSFEDETGKHEEKTELDENDDSDVEEAEDDLDPRMEKLVVVLGVAAAVIVAMLIIFLAGKAIGAFKFDIGNKKPNETTEQLTDTMVMVPNIIGKDFETARETLKTLGLDLYQVGEKDSNRPKGEILEQKTLEGTEVEAGTVIEVIVSSGKGKVVPNVVGLTEEEAETTLKDAGFSVEKERDYNTAEEGTIVEQDPKANSEAEDITSVTIIISKGPEDQGKVPKLVGMSKAEAEQALSQRLLSLGEVSEAYSNEAMAGTIISQQHNEGTRLEKGDTVNIVISKGPEQEDTTQPPETIYSGTVTIPEDMNPFASGENGRITIKMEDGTVLDDGTMSSANFPSNYDVTSKTPGNKTVYVYLDGEQIGSVDVSLN